VTAATNPMVGFGTGYLFDTSSSFFYPFLMSTASTTTFGLHRFGEVGSGGLGSAGFTAALASGDIIRCHGTYEAAS
jgi:hypothetical protein